MNTAIIPREQLSLLAEAFGIRSLLLFGSAASGREHPGSDVDLAVLLRDRDTDYSRMANLHYELQRLLPQKEVDLAPLNQADPLFLKKITEECRLLYGEPSEFYSLKMYAFRRYQDHKRFLAMERRYVRNFLERIPSGT